MAGGRASDEVFANHSAEVEVLRLRVMPYRRAKGSVIHASMNRPAAAFQGAAQASLTDSSRRGLALGRFNRPGVAREFKIADQAAKQSIGAVHRVGFPERRRVTLLDIRNLPGLRHASNNLTPLRAVDCRTVDAEDTSRLASRSATCVDRHRRGTVSIGRERGCFNTEGVRSAVGPSNRPVTGQPICHGDVGLGLLADDSIRTAPLSLSSRISVLSRIARGLQMLDDLPDSLIHRLDHRGEHGQPAGKIRNAHDLRPASPRTRILFSRETVGDVRRGRPGTTRPGSVSFPRPPPIESRFVSCGRTAPRAARPSRGR